MKTKLIVAAVITILFTNCKKEDNTSHACVSCDQWKKDHALDKSIITIRMYGSPIADNTKRVCFFNITSDNIEVDKSFDIPLDPLHNIFDTTIYLKKNDHVHAEMYTHICGIGYGGVISITPKNAVSAIFATMDSTTSILSVNYIYK